MSSKVTTSVLQEAVSRNTGKIATATMALFDFDRIYLAVQEFKYLRSWSNLRLERQRLEEFCLKHNDWYTLFIPQSELSIRNISDISKQEDILIRLLQDYTDRFYKSLKTAYEASSMILCMSRRRMILC